MTELRRKAVEAERLEPKAPIVSRLGVRPDDHDLVRVTAWDEGVDLIYGFRLRWGLADEDARPLGPDLDGPSPSYRAERRSLETRLATIDERLGVAPTRCRGRSIWGADPVDEPSERSSALAAA